MIKFIYSFILFMIAVAMMANPSFAKKKKIIYKKHTQFDFSGETVQGKVRAPELFYIFQRKRSEGHDVAEPPESLAHHVPVSLGIIRGELKK